MDFVVFDVSVLWEASDFVTFWTFSLNTHYSFIVFSHIQHPADSSYYLVFISIPYLIFAGIIPERGPTCKRWLAISAHRRCMRVSSFLLSLQIGKKWIVITSLPFSSNRNLPNLKRRLQTANTANAVEIARPSMVWKGCPNMVNFDLCCFYDFIISH